MSYLNSPVTALVAVNCACCSRPLCDAVSVETGVGPVCRERHGYNDAQGPADFRAAAMALGACEIATEDYAREFAALVCANDAHAAANKLAHAAALVAGSPEARKLAAVIHALGFTTLATKVASNAGAIETWYDNHPDLGETIAIKASYSPAFNQALKASNAQRRFDKTGAAAGGVKKVWHVRVADRSKLVAALRAAYAGRACAGPNGITTIKAAA